jgi:hypothetical protein
VDQEDLFEMEATRALKASSTNYLMTSDHHKYQNAFNQATHASGLRYAIYGQQQNEPLGLDQIKDSRGWCHSPLTFKLKKLHPARSDIYAKAILHLDEILRGEGQSIRALPQLTAWGKIASRVGNGRVELRSRLASLIGAGVKT